MNDEYSVGKWGKYCVVNYYGDNLAVTRKLYTDKNADGISILAKNGAPSSLENLQEFKGLKVILFHDTPQLQIDGLKHLPALEEIMLCGTSQVLDFSWVPNLQRLICDWHVGMFRNSESSNLLSLSMEKYKSKKGDLSDFPSFPYLQRIELLQSSIQNLTGINRFPTLKEIHLTYLSKLEELGRLNLPNLIEFVAEKCKKISDHDQIGNCLSLQELKLHECGTINSLYFINHLKNLKSFRFINTDVLDGDLSPLKRLPDVYFTEKRHFSGKVKDFNQTPKQWNIIS